MTNALSPPIQQPLAGVRILSLSLNLPGPAALQRCRAMGAACVKLEPPLPADATPENGLTGDPMSSYSPTGYAALQLGIRVLRANLKTPEGQHLLQHELANADLLLTSFRPSALTKLGLDWPSLQTSYPRLSMVAIFGDPGALAEQPGHDLTYAAQAGLITGVDLPATLFADMAGSLSVSEAILQALLMQRQTGVGQRIEVALSDAAAHLALPRAWGCMEAHTLLGGAHAGYRVYPCRDGRVALAALEPHFAKSLCLAAGLDWRGFAQMLEPSLRDAIGAFLARHTRSEIDALAAQHDIPLQTLPA